MSAAISHADGPANMVHPTSAEDESYNRDNGLTAIISESGSQASDTSKYDSYLHATCPRCHHWMNRIPIKLFRNGRRHGRFPCNKCRHVLFGLGGDSTQTTLVSQETISRRGSGTSVAGSPSAFHGCTNVRSLEPSGDGPLKPIFEASSSNGVSREPSQRSAAPREQSHLPVQPPQGQLQDSANGPIQGLSARARAEPYPEKTATILPDSRRFKKIKDHANRLVKKVKDIKNHMRKPRTAHRLSAETDTQMTPLGMCEMTMENAASSTSKPTALNLPTPSQGQRVSEQPSDERPSSAVINIARPNSTRGAAREDQVWSSQDELAAANKKRERIRNIRKEKRLQANALQKPRCECTEGCHCMQRETASRSSGEGQSRSVQLADIGPHLFPHGVESPEETQTTSTTESRRLSSDVSSEGRQQSLYRNEFAGIGDRFRERRRSGGRCRPISSLSQAPTAVSNGSSISLLGGPAYISRRPAGSRPQTPHLHISLDREPDQDEDSGGPTPTEHNTTSQRILPSAEDERAANTSSTLLEVVEDEIHDRSFFDHDGALLPPSADAE